MQGAKKKIFVIIGEHSGDLHGSNVIKELKNITSEWSFIGTGGDMFLQYAKKRLYNSQNMAVTGFWEVLKNYTFLKKVFNDVIKSIEEENPDVLLLVDYPGFNLRLLQSLDIKKKKIPVFYYIAPQVWAWKPHRIEILRKYVQHLIVIFPFETIFFKKYKVKAHYFGHPLTNYIKPQPNKDLLLQKFHLEKNKYTVTLLPGSRSSEISRHTPTLINFMNEYNKLHNDTQFLLSITNRKAQKNFTKIMQKCPKNCRIIEEETYSAIQCAHFVLVASGTATLETLLFKKPMVIFYKTSLLTYLIAKRFFRLSFLGMPNILSGEKIVPELIQKDFNAKKLITLTRHFLQNGLSKKTETSYEKIKNTLSEKDIYKKTAEFIKEQL